MTPVDSPASTLAYGPMTSSSSRPPTAQPPPTISLNQRHKIQQQLLQQQAAALAPAVPNGMRHLTSLTISVPSTHPTVSRPVVTSHAGHPPSTHPLPPHMDMPALLAPVSPHCDPGVPPPVLPFPVAKPSDEHAVAMHHKQLPSLHQQHQMSAPRSRSTAESGLLLQYRGSHGATALSPSSELPAMGDPLLRTAKQRPSISLHQPPPPHPPMLHPTTQSSATIPPLMAPPPTRPEVGAAHAHRVLGKLLKPPPFGEQAAQVVHFRFIPTRSLELYARPHDKTDTHSSMFDTTLLSGLGFAFEQLYCCMLKTVKNTCVVVFFFS